MQRLIGILRAAGVRFSRDGCAFLAQALAYNAVFAMIPLGLLAIAVFGFIFGSQDGQDLVISTIDDVAPTLHDILADNLKNAIATRGISGAIAIVALVWSGKNLFQGLAFALNRALGVPAGRPLIHDIALSIVMLPAMGLLLLLSTVVPPAVTYLARAGGFSSPALAQITAFGVSILLIFVVATTLYRFLPNRKLPWTFGISGGVFTAIAYEIAQIAFTVFTAHANLFHVYGALSTVLALLLWFYLMGIIFLYGAEISAVRLEEGALPQSGTNT
ncbi:MAG: YihY/virulence factor BrkB family protein [Vulcanimicrobiaceae bacterium]